MSSRWGPSPSTCSPRGHRPATPRNWPGFCGTRKGLSISSVLDGAGPKLEEMIQWSTHPDVLTRIGSVEDFLTLLDEVEDELTAPRKPSSTTRCKPSKATDCRKDSSSGGSSVREPRPKPCSSQGRQGVRSQGGLNDDDNARLHEEAEALRTIHSEFIVAIDDNLEIGGRTVLVLQKAGEGRWRPS